MPRRQAHTRLVLLVVFILPPMGVAAAPMGSAAPTVATAAANAADPNASLVDAPAPALAPAPVPDPAPAPAEEVQTADPQGQADAAPDDPEAVLPTEIDADASPLREAFPTYLGVAWGWNAMDGLGLRGGYFLNPH